MKHIILLTLCALATPQVQTIITNGQVLTVERSVERSADEYAVVERSADEYAVYGSKAGLVHAIALKLVHAIALKAEVFE